MIREIASHVYERRVQPEGLDWFINTFLICLDQANVYIDSGLGSKAIEELVPYGDPNKPNILIYTHYHFDHVWGSKGASFAKIIACEPFNTLLQEDFELSYAYFKEIQEGEVACVYADTLIDYMTQMGPLTLYPAPGHTPDGLMVHYPQMGLLFMGDNLADHGKGIIPDLQDLEAYKKTIELAISLESKTLIGSHCDEQSSKALDSIMKSLTSLYSV
jgi:glyoxylase-like metal-dependent hydrolase (beta-lactamase superfamily II)